MRFEPGDWEVYERVNRRFADAVLEDARDDDVVFVHDFHLLLLPGMLRAARPRLRIGFILHVPFPSSEVFRILPEREAVLRGMMGADLVVFHTMAYLRHFRTSLSRVLGIEVGSCEIPHQGRTVRLRALPLAIECFDRLRALANPLGLFSEDVAPESGRLLGNFPQAYTHVGLVNAAMTIGELLRARSGKHHAWS